MANRTRAYGHTTTTFAEPADTTLIYRVVCERDVDDTPFDDEAGFVEDAREAADAGLKAAVGTAEETPEPGPETVFDHVYAETPPRLREQRAEVLERAGGDR